MKRKLLIVFLSIISAVCLCIGIAACGDDSTSGENASEGLKYTLSTDGTYYTVSGIGECTDTEIVIPSKYKKLPVTTIGNSAFYTSSTITSITIPDSVTTIGDFAFTGCTSLTSVYYGGTADGWVSISFGNESSNPLFNANNLYINGTLATDITLENATSIGAYAFYNYVPLESITIPVSVTSIGENAFEENYGTYMKYGDLKLKDVYYEGTASQWASISFGELSDFGILYSNPLCCADNLYLNGTLATDITIENVTAINDSAFSCCTSLKSVTIGSGVTSVGISAFYACTSLTNVSIGSDVTSIDGWAFYFCESLTSVSIDSVTSVGDLVFTGCNSLESVTIGSGVTANGYEAFLGCTSLTSITVSSGNTAYKLIDGVLYTYDETELLLYPAGKTDTSFTIPDTVTKIGNDAFYGCSNLTSVTIPDSVTEIGSMAFYNCSKLESVYYKGTADKWNGITIDSYNTYLTNSTIYYYAENDGTTTETGNYWYYNANGEIVTWVVE
ncbi:MAG: leucine-rich repeat domain-containing protein [Clostridia bacterium]|nr:leucine-rich repeat domain-containing protein [Clostridia bacterium]